MPAQRRDEIAAELRGSIEDMIEGRTAAGEDTATAEREVLTELGNPAQLAARYADRRLQLIGPTYYLAWWRLLKLLLSFVPALVGVVVGLVEGGRRRPRAGRSAPASARPSRSRCRSASGSPWSSRSWNAPTPRWTCRSGRSTNSPSDQPNRQITLTDTAAVVGLLVLVIAYLPLQHFRSFVPDPTAATCRSSTRRCGASGCRS